MLSFECQDGTVELKKGKFGDYIRYNHKNFKIDKKKIFSIPRGTDLDYFNPEDISQSIIDDKKESLNISREDTVISVPSRFSKWKGHKQILSFLSSQPPSIQKILKLMREKLNLRKCQILLDVF